MNQASKLSVAMELIEKQIAEISKKMHNSEEKLNVKYQELLKTRDKIYKNNENEIDKIIEERKK
jgi:galactokinase/mevalonate kinase-like predicted kinase